MRQRVAGVWATCGFVVLGAAGAAEADLSKPFVADKDTICLSHLDDVAGGEVEHSVSGGQPGQVLSHRGAAALQLSDEVRTGVRGVAEEDGDPQ